MPTATRPSPSPSQGNVSNGPRNGSGQGSGSEGAGGGIGPVNSSVRGKHRKYFFANHWYCLNLFSRIREDGRFSFGVCEGFQGVRVVCAHRPLGLQQMSRKMTKPFPPRETIDAKLPDGPLTRTTSTTATSVDLLRKEHLPALIKLAAVELARRDHDAIR